MGTLEDIRKLLQDIIAPDLKALHTRMDYIEKHMEAEFSNLREEMKAFRSETREEFKAVRTETQKEFELLRLDLRTGFARLETQALMMERIERLEGKEHRGV